MGEPRVVHCKKEDFDVYIGRPTFWGNPFQIGEDGDREMVILEYERWIHERPHMIELAKQQLRGKVLGCWCSPRACHGDVLLRIANGEE